METRQSSPNSLQTHFVDIPEVLPEEEEEEEAEEGKTIMTDKVKRGLNKQPNRSVRDVRRTHRNFSRQVSLETGFSVLNRESKAKEERKTLPRSGRSFGGFDSANQIGAEARKGDFSIFKTKSTLSKQNSLLPTRKEKEVESQKIEGSGRLDESVDTSVPAGRYFAALRGPELDQVKVTLLQSNTLNAVNFQYLYTTFAYLCAGL